MAENIEWQGSVGDAWASEWQRTDRSFRDLTGHLLERIGQFEGNTVLDIGCGAGEVSIAVAQDRPQAAVLGVDISPQLLEVARVRAGSLANLSFLESDASKWQPQDAEQPDLLVSRHGVMFFPDPVAAFSHIRSVAADGAHLCFSCFREPRENELFTRVGALLPKTGAAPDPNAPGPFAFGNRDRVARIFAEAGWGAVEFEPVDYPMVVGAGADPVADAVGYFQRIGPAARVIAELPQSERDSIVAALGDLAREQFDGTQVTLATAAWIVSARAG